MSGYTEQHREQLQKSTKAQLFKMGYSRRQAVRIHKGENPGNWPKMRYGMGK